MSRRKWSSKDKFMIVLEGLKIMSGKTENKNLISLWRGKGSFLKLNSFIFENVFVGRRC